MDSTENKKLLLEAIDNYDLLTPVTKTILKTFVDIAVDNVVIISVLKLSQLAGVSRPGTYAALKALEEQGIIERMPVSGKKLTSFFLKTGKLKGIIKFYTPRKNLLHK